MADQPELFSVAEQRPYSEGDLLAEAAQHLRDMDDPLGDEVIRLATADLLAAAALAWPLVPPEPPRNPRDRRLVYAAVALARAYVEARS